MIVDDSWILRLLDWETYILSGPVLIVFVWFGFCCVFFYLVVFVFIVSF